ncbi:amino acid aminotransferase [Phenylobacterium sp.]|uniref:amino acid aminotransferase n=1 Tax=Phenylobacterium sp. TaxID=1871053 RepID=UPI002FDA2A66
MTTLQKARSDVLFEGLTPQPPDVVLSLIRAFAEDPRAGKIDLGVGVYKDEAGATPVFAAMKAAEARLLETQATKSYLGPEGDFGFLEAIAPVAFGHTLAQTGMFGVQTPGGTGALRLAAELANAGRPGATLWLGTPSWPIHSQIFAEAGLNVRTFPQYDAAAQRLLFDEMLGALETAQAGDVVLLHGCCHNPSGADPDADQWRQIARSLAERCLVPLIDLAYQGLGEGLEPDALGLRAVLDQCESAMVAYSCDKNFGLYRERTGALFVRAGRHQEAARTNVLKFARCGWSMPPDHGAAAARIILEDADLAAQWRAELETCRQRLASVRQILAKADPRLAPIGAQKGMFSILPLNPDQVGRMRAAFGVYMLGNGRINLAGLTPSNIEAFVRAFGACAEE